MQVLIHVEYSGMISIVTKDFVCVFHKGHKHWFINIKV